MARGRLTRREWMALAAGAIGSGALVRGQTMRPLGVQLYTVRDLLKEKAPETLKAIAAIGYKDVELYDRETLAQIVPLAKQVGLQPVATHVEAALVTGRPATKDKPGTPPDFVAQARAFDEIRALGISHAIVAYLAKEDRGKDAAWWQRLAQLMNNAGKVAKAAGITFAYHNHGFEFEKLPDGRRPLDILIDTFDPALVKFELDVFWISITGADPVTLITQLGPRVSLLHLKDKAKNAPVETDDAKVAKSTFVEAGSGAVDFPAVLKAGKAAGVEHYFVEQDQTPGDPIASLEKSYAYLSRLT